MSQRIQELAEQAGNHYRTTTPGADTFTNPVYGVIPEKFLDKFAELIIRECMSKTAGYLFEDEFGNQDVKEASEELAKHFGVE